MDENEKEIIAQGTSSFSENILVWRQQLIQRVLRVMVVFGLLMVTAGSYTAYTNHDLWAVGVYIGVYVALVFLTLWQQAPYVLQVGITQLLLYTITLVVFITRGIGDSSRLYLLTMVFVSGLFWGWRVSLFTLGLAFLTMVGLGWAFTTGAITAYKEVVSTDLNSWVALTIELLSMSVFIALLLNYFTLRFDGYMTQSHKLAQELAENQERLEKQVRERTVDLERRSAQLEMAAQVAREAAEIRDVEQLLEQTVQLISDRFGFYHTGIFLVDAAGEYAVLRAASSEGGQRMLARGHRLKVGEVGIVGYATGRGEHRIALDVGTDASYFNNPDLPATHSEMALPLRVRGNIIGALDVQSRKPAAFTPEDLTVLQTLADQVAVAIENARLFTTSQAALEATRRAYGELSREAWGELLRTKRELGARYDPQAILPLDERWREEMKLAVREKRAVLAVDARLDTIAVPLTVRGQVIGVLDAHKPDAGGAWMPEEIALLETLAEQLGMALESARLYEDSQQRAARERLTTEITDKMRRAAGIEDIVQTAVDELYQALGTSRAFVRLGNLPASGAAPDAAIDGKPERGEG
ncbi:MAG TPA: GAF domain-containing protein [Thermoflexia bacterium]|nr:GAF domain-containing protein [Thermoflexia bacterium]